MKNSTRILLLCFLVTGAFSAWSKQGNGTANSQYATTSIYTEDFAGGFPAGWTRTDVAGHGVNWKYTTTGTFGTGIHDSLSVAGTSATDGYVIYDSDSAGGSVGGENANLRSPRIDCSGKNTVHLTFNEYLKHYSETATVAVSTNGTTWVDVHNSSSGLNQDEATTNPHYLDIDITSIAANQDSVYVRFNFTGDYDYFWMIDDFELYTLSGIDAAVTNIASPESGCTLLSDTEAVTISLYNYGAALITGFNVTYILDGGNPVTQAISDSIQSGSGRDFTFTTSGDFSLPGMHDITAYVSLTGDSTHSNDTIIGHIYNGPTVIDATHSHFMGFEPTDDLSGYDVEDANNDTLAWMLSTSLPHSGAYSGQVSAPVADDWLFTSCLNFTAGQPYTISYYSRTITTSTRANLDIRLLTDQNSGSAIQTILPPTIINNLFYQQTHQQFSVPSTGTYYIGFHVTTADSLVGFLLDDISIGTDSSTGISIAEKSSFSLFPNPSRGIVYVTSTHSGSTKIEVLNAIGELVFSDITNDMTSYKISLSNEKAGMYMVRLTSGNEVMTKVIAKE